MERKTVKIQEVPPPKWINNKDKVLCIRLTEVDLELLRVSAEEKGLNVSTLVRTIIKAYLDKST